MYSPTLPKTGKNSQQLKRDRVKSSSKDQLNLFICEPSPRRRLAVQERLALSAKLATASHHRANAARYWLIYNHVRRSFRPLFYRPEVDYILGHFKGRAELIKATRFGQIAERAVTYFMNRGVVA